MTDKAKRSDKDDGADDLIEISKNIDDIEAQIKALQVEKRRLKRGVSQAERRARTHALIVLGGIVASVFGDDGKNDAWTKIDYAAVEAYVGKYGYAIAKCKAPKLVPTAATERLRRWERSGEWLPDPDDDDDAASDGTAHGDTIAN